MGSSYQYDVSKARVNITLDIETGNAKKKKELPCKLLILADLSNNSQITEQNARLKINKHNFDAVLKTLSPCLTITMPNFINQSETDLTSTLVFQSIKDFLPQNIAAQIPELRNLIAMRNLLKDLKANIVDNMALRKELENIIKNQKQLKMLKNELQQLVLLPVVEKN